MSLFIDATDKQQSILRDLKQLTYTELKNISKMSLKSLIDEKYSSCMEVSKNIDKKGRVSIVIKVEDLSLPESIENQLLEDVVIEGAWSTDGFDMLPDGTLIEMHPDEFDED